MSRPLVPALVKLARPTPVLGTAGQVMLGAYLGEGGDAVTSGRVLSGAVAMALVTVVGNVVNDLRDVAADRINRPGRPLITGAVSGAAARRLAAAAALGAALLVLRWPEVVAIVVIMVLSVAYSFGVKRLPVVANGYVAALAGTPLLVGAYASGGGLRTAGLAAVVLVAFMFGYEVLKTLRDVDGDRHAGFRTVASAWGEHVAVAVYRWSVGVFALLAALPLALTPAGLPYLLLMGGGAVMTSIVLAYRIGCAPTETTTRWALRISLVCWLPGLLALQDLR